MMRPLLLFALALSLHPSLHAAEKFVPAAARTAGANGTFFMSDLRLVNLSSAAATFELTFLPSNQDNSGALPVSMTVPARAAKELDDVLRSVFQLDGGGGAVRIVSGADFTATSRTYTGSSNCPGTYGQFIPAVESSRARARSVLANIRSSNDPIRGFRTNVGMVNPASANIAVDLTLRAMSGGVIARASRILLPLSHTQESITQLFPVSLTDDDYFIEITAPTPLFAYASVIDNESGDSIFILAEEDTGTASSNLVTARQWVFEPSTIEVLAGQQVTLQVRAIDVDHGIAFSGVGPITCSSQQGGLCILRPNQTVTVTFVPQTRGSFAFFCTRFCGDSTSGDAGHATMRGTIVVK